ncbi:MAG: shikimate kinase [Methanobacteriota archaeon]|nr:MAG: shikimate kinase [Euryarchaeota archaeon]
MEANIYLIGYMGVGKTSVGKELSKKMSLTYVDTDDVVVEIAGKDIPSIFNDDGEIAFRELEIEAVKRVCSKKGCVVSLGGGAVLNYINVLRMKKTGTVVLLKASPEEIVRRLEGDGSRPLLNGLTNDEKIAKIREMLSYREPFYERAADDIINTDGKTVDEIASKIMAVVA